MWGRASFQVFVGVKVGLWVACKRVFVLCGSDVGLACDQGVMVYFLLVLSCCVAAKMAPNSLAEKLCFS
jgi:hypothetical protein